MGRFYAALAKDPHEGFIPVNGAVKQVLRLPTATLSPKLAPIYGYKSDELRFVGSS
jgi:hypothetical protein